MGKRQGVIQNGKALGREGRKFGGLEDKGAKEREWSKISQLLTPRSGYRGLDYD